MGPIALLLFGGAGLGLIAVFIWVGTSGLAPKPKLLARSTLGALAVVPTLLAVFLVPQERSTLAEQLASAQRPEPARESREEPRIGPIEPTTASASLPAQLNTLKAAPSEPEVASSEREPQINTSTEGDTIGHSVPREPEPRSPELNTATSVEADPPQPARRPSTDLADTSKHEGGGNQAPATTASETASNQRSQPSSGNTTGNASAVSAFMSTHNASAITEVPLSFDLHSLPASSWAPKELDENPRRN